MKKVRIIYYTDKEDNTKQVLCVVPSDIDIRKKEYVDFIAKELYETFNSVYQTTMDDAKEIAFAIVHHEFGFLFDYEFGIEEKPFFNVK